MLAALLPFLVSAAILAWLYTADRDHRIAGWFFDEAQGIWPWQGHGFTMRVLHDGGTRLIFLIALASLLIAILGGFWVLSAAWRRPALFVLLSIAVSAGVVGLLKSVSPDPSPWMATRFGGEIEHGRLFASVSPSGVLGQGSPGAFASGGFALMSLYYCLRRRNPRCAWAWLVAGWCIGSGFGAVQVVRGAHFPSHNYWTAVLVWSVCTLLYWGPFRGRTEARRT
jgi:membrane-associated PAP2 superfamily phosphatase